MKIDQYIFKINILMKIKDLNLQLMDVLLTQSANYLESNALKIFIIIIEFYDNLN